MPLSDDTIFQASLKDVLEDENPQKRAGGAKNNALSLATAKYYDPSLTRANTALKTHVLRANARFKPCLVKARRRTLLGTLGARLEYYAWQYHEELAPGNHAVTPAPAALDIQNLNQNGGPMNHRANHAVVTITDQFIAYLGQVMTNVNNDWADLETVFFPGWDLVSVEEIVCTGSDSHKAGKSVVILLLKAKRKPPFPHPATRGERFRNKLAYQPEKIVRLVYKPSDLTLDYLLAGDTAAVAGVGGVPAPPAGGSLFENINTLIGGAGVAHLTDPQFANRTHPLLPTYPIMPMNTGNIAAAYGYLEFLSHIPKAEPHPAGALNPVAFRTGALRTADRAKWDWVTDDDNDLIDYYRIFGWYCAIGLNFGIADAHNQNLIVHRKKPYLIDMEISFKWICETIGKTGLQDVMASPGPSKKGDRCQMFFKNGATLERTTGNSARDYIRLAITEALAMFAADPGGALAGWLASGVVGGAVARYTPKATREFGSALRGVYGGAHALAAVPAGALPWAGMPWAFDLREWYNGNQTEHRPNFALNVPLHSYQDYLNCDYPCYYQFLNQADLYDCRGVAVAIAQPLTAWNALPVPPGNANRNRLISGVHYFDHYPGRYLFEIDIATLAGPGNTLVHLNANIIADLTGTFGGNGIVLTGAAVESMEKAGEHWRIIDGPAIYHVRVVAGTTTVKVYQAGTAIQMAQTQFNRLTNVPAFHTQLRVDAHAYVGASYPTANVPGGPPLHDGF